MEQKNTIVKCKARPDCLFNHNGVCDNYVINIGTNGKCESYIETATCKDCEYYEDTKLLQCKCSKDGYYKIRTAPICSDFKAKTGVVGEYRGKRANCNFISDGMDQEIVDEVCKPFDIKLPTAETNQWKAEYDCYTCLHNDHGECEFKTKPMITPQGRCCRYEI